jgi:hypothetical protein
MRLFRSVLSLILALAILAVALPVAFGSGAGGAGAAPVEVFSSGSLLAPDASGGAGLSIAGMVPGQSRSATIRLAGKGPSGAQVSLAAQIADRVPPGHTPLSSALILRVARTGSGAVIYDGPIGRMPRLRLGRMSAAGSAYRFTVTMAPGAGNGVEGSALSASFAWSAS